MAMNPIPRLPGAGLSSSAQKPVLVTAVFVVFVMRALVLTLSCAYFGTC